jgi:GxxExxY protein
MLEFPEQKDPLTDKIIGCAIEVHRTLGPGLLESTYESALGVEFEIDGIQFQRQVICPVSYKGRIVGDYRLDLLVENSVIVEIKSVERHDPIFEAQLLTYLKITGHKRGLLLNFNTRLLKEGIKRFVLYTLCSLCLCGK